LADDSIVCIPFSLVLCFGWAVCRFYWLYCSGVSSQGGASSLSGTAVCRRRHICRRCSSLLLSPVTNNSSLHFSKTKASKRDSMPC